LKHTSSSNVNYSHIHNGSSNIEVSHGAPRGLHRNILHIFANNFMWIYENIYENILVIITTNFSFVLLVFVFLINGTN